MLKATLVQLTIDILSLRAYGNTIKSFINESVRFDLRPEQKRVKEREGVHESRYILMLKSYE